MKSVGRYPYAMWGHAHLTPESQGVGKTRQITFLGSATPAEST